MKEGMEEACRNSDYIFKMMGSGIFFANSKIKTLGDRKQTGI